MKPIGYKHPPQTSCLENLPIQKAMLLNCSFRGSQKAFDVILVVTGNPHLAGAQILDFFVSPKGLLIKFQRCGDRLHKNCLSAYGTRPSIYCFTSVRLKKIGETEPGLYLLMNGGTWELIGLVGHMWHEPWKILVLKKKSMGSSKLCLFFNLLATKWIQPNEPNQSQTKAKPTKKQANWDFPVRHPSVYQVKLLVQGFFQRVKISHQKNPWLHVCFRFF